MNILQDILYKVSIEAIKGQTNVTVNKVHFDSRDVAFNDVFVAIKGSGTDGHQFIQKAINQGAIAIICQEFPEIIVNGVTYIKVKNSSEALAFMAANVFDNPSKKLKLIGITGTNGKTTVASLSYQLFSNAGFACGLISTVKILIDKEEYPATHTTPDAITINKYLSKMVDAGVTYCFMEVSSHGIHQSRTAGLYFEGGVFTNLSHDHLDYHKTFSEYRDVKKSFFDGLPKTSFVVTNADDKNGEVMVQNTKARVITYALKSVANIHGQILENQFGGMLMKINQQEIWVKLIGAFNAYNMLSIYAIAEQLGLNSMDIYKHLSELESVSGRFQYFVSSDKITAIVDYAHTPDALKNVLETIDKIRTKNEKLITVVGCGGDRDKAKRPLMAAIACEWSDHVIFTSDNPRTEDPKLILKDIESGVPPQHFKKTITIEDREQAIKSASMHANPNDIILIAGKGHETYQEIMGVKYDFDDLAIIKQFLNQKTT